MKKTVIVLIIFCIGIALAAQTQNPLPDPLKADALSSLKANALEYAGKAQAFYSSGDYLSAAGAYLAYLERRPGDETALYNLACCYGLLNQPAYASETLALAYKAGFSDLEHISKDTDFDLVRGTGEFSAIMDSLKVWTEKKAALEGERRYYKISSLLPYRLYLPKGFDPSQSYHLLIGLHGFGDTAKAFGYLSRIIGDYPVILAVPEAPYQLDWMKEQGYGWIPFLKADDPLSHYSDAGLEQALLALVRNLKQEYKVSDTTLWGFSQGASQTFILGLRNPKVFSRIIPFGGWLEPNVISAKQLKAANRLKVFIAHGTGDQIVPYESSMEADKILREAKLDVTLQSFEGPHTVDPVSLRMALDWLTEER
ncbi:MAG TPA: alpha/beta hydrolase-fold protein [Candidatus Cloacimonadota bacterium]|nr:alpha/beta hydrolase-fold protein [Candidatus Cloacimonadota bacterium]